VIQTAAEFGVEKLIFIGTSCMFPRDAELPVHENSLLTGKLEDSVEAYAIAKIAGWRLCKAYWEQHGKRFMTVCPSNLYGPNDSYDLDRAHVIPALIHKLSIAMINGTPFVVWGDGEAVREFMHADDAADAIATVLDRYNSPEPINLGTGHSTTIRELVEMLVDIAGFRGDVVWDTGQPTGIPRKTFSTEKLDALGWKPSISLREGLEATWKEFTEKVLTRP
jgi:GDP-L-fucose synthase